MPGRRDGGPQAAVNARVYASPALVKQYAGRPVTVAEHAVLDSLRPALEGKRVLELGCGAGAITAELLSSRIELVGVDVSPAMVAHCRVRFPQARFLVGDLRDLSALPDESADVVVAADNVIDVLSHEERPLVLRELRRLLSDGGVLYFSTHNRRSEEALRQAIGGPRLRPRGSSSGLVRALAGFVAGTFNHRRLARYQKLEEDWGILNDPAHRWGLLHHYITREAERRELAACGFELAEVWGMTGRRLGPSDDDSAFSTLHYVARTATP